MKPTLLVLAAGMGSRYGGLKQLDRFGPNGETIMDYSIYGALAAGFGKLVFVIRRDFESAFREAVGSKYEGRVPVEYVFQDLADLPAGFSVPAGRAKPWGTAHAIWCARRAIAEPFASINADDYYGKTSMRVVAEHLGRAPRAGGLPEYCMAGYRLLQTVAEGSAVARGIGKLDGNGYLETLVERRNVKRTGDAVTFDDEEGNTRPAVGDELVSMNMWGFTPDLFPQLEQHLVTFLEALDRARPDAECLIPVVIDEIIKEKAARVRVLPTSDPWFGVTNPDDKASVTAAIQALVDRGEYPSPLWGAGDRR